MSKRVAIILVNYKDYARRFLPACYESLKKQDYSGEMKLFIVDNESSSESFDYLKAQAPEAEIIRNNTNDGFAKGNNDALKLALEEGYDYLCLLNMDTISDPMAIKNLVLTMESDPKIGGAQAKLLLHPDVEKINSLGNATHFLGFGYCLGYQEGAVKYQDQSEEKDIFYPSGAAVMFGAAALKKVGLFDEEFWMYNEDQDLGWRLWLRGYRCVLSPQSIVYHHYEFSRSIAKYYYLDRNRLLAIFKNYHCLTLILIFPALLLMELGLVFFSLTGGWFKEKLRVRGYFLKASTRNYLRRARKLSQQNRVRGEKEIVKMLSSKISHQEIDSPFLKIANFFLGLYWRLIKAVIIIINP